MDRLLIVDEEEFAARMRIDVERTMREVMRAVNAAADGNVINGSEMQVRDLMAQLRQRAFQSALQMRIDSTESSFSPSAGRGGQVEAEQGAAFPERAERQRTS